MPKPQLPRDEIESGNTNEVRPLPENTNLSMAKTECGRETDVRLVHPQNMPTEIIVSEFESCTDVKLVQS
jgi:hypothetical protein